MLGHLPLSANAPPEQFVALALDLRRRLGTNNKGRRWTRSGSMSAFLSIWAGLPGIPMIRTAFLTRLWCRSHGQWRSITSRCLAKGPQLAGFDVGGSVSAETFSRPEPILGHLSLRGGIPFPGKLARQQRAG